MFSSSSRRTPQGSSQWVPLPVWAHVWDCPSAGAAPCTWTYWAPLVSHGPTSQVHVSLDGNPSFCVICKLAVSSPPCWNSSFPFGTGALQCCPPVLDIKHNDTDTRSRMAQSLDQANLQCWALLLCCCWGVSSPMCLAFSRTNPARLTPSGLALSSHSHFAPQTLFRRRQALPHIGSALGCLFWWIVGVHLTLM